MPASRGLAAAGEQPGPPSSEAGASCRRNKTSWTEATEKDWLWVGLTDEVTVFMIADNRGADMARSILETDREKIVISDRYASYDWIEARQFFWSHLRRDFQAMIDRQDEGSVIGKRNCLGPRIGCSTGGTRSRWDHRLEYVPGLRPAVAVGRAAGPGSGYVVRQEQDSGHLPRVAGG
jgi:hypothetical protein